MVKVADRSAVGRVALTGDPGLRVPEDAFRQPLVGLLNLADQGLQLAAKMTKGEKEREAREQGGLLQKSEAGNALAEAFGAAEPPAPLPPRKPELPEEMARRLRQGAATTARRAQAAEGRREMAQAAQAVLAPPDTPAAELPGRLKAEAGKAMKAGLARARQAGLSEEDLARLEADLGAQELLLLEQGLAEQSARLEAGTEAQRAAEAGELVETLRRDPGLAPSADAALAELLADFAPGFREGALEGFGSAVRRRLATAEVEGLLARGEADAAAEALERALDLPETARRHLRREISAQGTRQPLEDRALAQAVTAGLIAEAEAGQPIDALRLRQVERLAGPEALKGLRGDLERAAERGRIAERLAILPREAWLEVLLEEGFDPAGLDLAGDEPAAARDPRRAQLAQAGGDDTAGPEDERRGPSEREIKDFLSETAELSDEGFREAAAGFGLDPEMAALFRDMLLVTPETEAGVRQRIRKALPFGFGAVRNEVRTVLDQILMTDDGETRRRLIEPQLKFARADRDLAADAAAGGFRPGATRPMRRLGVTQGGGRKGQGSKPDEGRDPEAPQAGRPASRGTGGLPVGQPDPLLTSRTIVQPVEDRQRLLEMAAQTKPDFDRQLKAITKAIPGTKADLSRVKADDSRLTFKLHELQNEMRTAGATPASSDSGAHLIRDYLAGRLVPEDDGALAGVLARVRKDFVVVDEKNFMKKPKATTGYTALHLQVRHQNGLTIELQVMPPPFKKAADRQREIFEKYRDFGDDIPERLRSQWKRDLETSRSIFGQAWEEWLAAGNADLRSRE